MVIPTWGALGGAGRPDDGVTPRGEAVDAPGGIEYYNQGMDAPMCDGGPRQQC